jgi:putative heme-binding domain-containing protein
MKCVIILLWYSAFVFAADTGTDIYRANCAFCHGLEGRGGRGPSLVSAHVQQETSDDALKTIIHGGISGTGMPAFDLEPQDLDALVHAIRHLGGQGSAGAAVRGDAAHGQRVFAKNGCASCHRVGDQGSVFGPDLSRIGAARSAEYLRESIVNPSADIAPDYAGVTVETRDGRRIIGVRVSEDTFTVELRLPDQTLQGFEKSAVRAVTDLDKSLMPAYSLSVADLDDLVAYLASLRASSNGQVVLREKGIQ